MSRSEGGAKSVLITPHLTGAIFLISLKVCGVITGVERDWRISAPAALQLL